MEGRQHILANSFEILSLGKAMFIFLGELDIVANCFLVAWTEISKLPLYFTPSSISDEIVETYCPQKG